MRTHRFIFAAFVVILAGCSRAQVTDGAAEVARVTPAPVESPFPQPSSEATPSVPAPSPSVPASATPSPLPSPLPSPNPFPSAVSGLLVLPVPFVPQAPYAVWDELHNEACEEASMLMADAFFSGESLNAHLMEQGILNLVKWETANGYGMDVTAAETALILRDYFQLSAAVEANPTVESIREHLSAGRLVLLPLSGRDIGNPYFRQPGPLYHMLVVRGHDPERREFVTNDPGTRRGEQYRYAETTLLSAVHDWPLAGKTKDDVTETLLRASPPVAIIVGRAGDRW